MRHQSTRLRQHVPRRLRRGLLRTAAAAAVLPVVAFAAAAPAHAQDDAPYDDPAAAAASWLAAQSSGDHFEFNGAPNVGATLDALIGLMAAGVGGDQVQASLEWINDPDTLGSYVYPGEGEDAPIALGSAGKVMYVVATAGGDPTDFGGVKLADEAAEAPTEGLDGGTLSWAALGLSRTEDGVSEEVTAALLAAQCDDGGFSYSVPESGSCTGDPDTTGTAVSALTAIGEDGADARAGALHWLEDHQGEDGSFDGGFGANANSTALAAQALLASGDAAEAAEAAVAYLIGLQIGCGEDGAGAIRFSDPEDPETGAASRLLATAQALVPLSGQNLAELDASDLAADVPAVSCGSADDGAATDEASGEAADEDGNAWVPWVIVGAAVVLVAAVAFLLVRGRRGAAAARSESAEGKGGE